MSSTATKPRIITTGRGKSRVVRIIAEPTADPESRSPYESAQCRAKIELEPEIGSQVVTGWQPNLTCTRCTPSF